MSDHERRLSIAALDPRLRHPLDGPALHPQLRRDRPVPGRPGQRHGRAGGDPPLLAAVHGLALYAYRLYAQRRYREAHPLLLAYSFFGLTTLGHFLDGKPDIAPFWFATIFTDALAGLAVLAFTISSMRSVAART